ncbi:GspH/FimT family pseudopilin [Pseudomonas sp. RIT-PI-AD]|uniref:GspH/FimT family pseudopilin n=1 Tax=Pseudomonas sp. RIT-PI-AD TaxID=3035294 RepID=UPI0021D8751E|nr:GspH/FimT family pseudopilin [Pseudomonas sp. RIT-PI-AD]
MPSANKLAGFTLIELMITVSLLGIFAALAVPSFTQFINNNRTQAASNEVYGLLQYARSLAVQNRASMSACLKNGSWMIKKKCTDADSTSLRTLAQPANTVTKSKPDNIVFNWNGTATAATILTCYNDQAASGFTTLIQSSGSIRMFPRGKKDAGGTDMSTCTP